MLNIERLEPLLATLPRTSSAHHTCYMPTSTQILSDLSRHASSPTHRTINSWIVTEQGRTPPRRRSSGHASSSIIPLELLAPTALLAGASQQRPRSLAERSLLGSSRHRDPAAEPNSEATGSRSRAEFSRRPMSENRVRRSRRGSSAAAAPFRFRCPPSPAPAAESGALAKAESSGRAAAGLSGLLLRVPGRPERESAAAVPWRRQTRSLVKAL